MFNRRRRMLMYMRREDFASYCYVLHKLGLKDVYTEIVSACQLGTNPFRRQRSRHSACQHPLTHCRAFAFAGS